VVNKALIEKGGNNKDGSADANGAPLNNGISRDEEILMRDETINQLQKRIREL